MRLKKIKLAGFKSFVDPTTIVFPSEIVGIVGPNGCGKSNIIDAVRWVMGESSAKTLRGDSMADVIFSGSSARKPVGHATVELVFDNSAGTAPGPYARYSEISIRREVTRDGQSEYYLNKTRCRRKDIRDIFLGTGLGPRAYSIIEQGMVTRIVEGKPEDLRAFVEEAAGISKYKDRRRETETRMRHTRENLERVADIRSELQTQLQRLKRQSRAAARYKELKQEERQVQAELLALRWRELEAQARGHDAALGRLETELEAKRAEQRRIEARIEALRQQQAEALEQFNTIQGEFYRVGAEIASTEQAITHARETHEQRLQEREQIEQAVAAASRQLDSDRARVESLQQRHRESGPRLEKYARACVQAEQALASAERAMEGWRERWEAFGQEAAQSGKESELEKAQARALNEGLERLRERETRLAAELEEVARLLAARGLDGLRAQAAELDARWNRAKARLEELEAAIRRLRTEAEQAAAELEDVSGRRHATEARLASLEELQAAALGADDPALNAWLERRGLQKAPRLSEVLEIEPGWEEAVDRVLGEAGGALCLPALGAVQGDLVSLSESNLFVIERGGTQPGAEERERLLDKVRAQDLDLAPLLAGIYTADDAAEAFARRTELSAGEAIVTPDGLMVGRNWVSVANRSAEGGQGGIVARARAIERLKAQLEELRARFEQLRAEAHARQERLEALESDLQAERQGFAEMTEKRTAAHNRLGREEAHGAQVEARRERIETELAELRGQIERDAQRVAAAREKARAAAGRADRLQARRRTLESERDRLAARLAEARAAVDAARDARHREELEHKALQTALESARESVERLEQQLETFAQRRRALEAALAEGTAPEQALKQKLAGRLEARMAVEARLKEARERMQAIEQALRAEEQARSRQEEASQEVRERLEQQRVSGKELSVRKETIEEQIRAAGFVPQELCAQLPAEATEAGWRERLEGIERRLARIGPVNLVAIEEYEEQSERKKYLDQQYEDLSQALATLENAIRKIDRETRARFRETFERINAGFQEFFPRLFGGGHAYLELTEKDLLSAGIVVMARPPGKRNSTIHLLSGGEKALTAVALLFAFFNLNPAPFCLLDEVDAPLDDANVERYCETLRTLAERSQMIYITHNKISMEAADVLIGVTMSEPGVSRLVAVDVVDAVKLAVQ